MLKISVNISICYRVSALILDKISVIGTSAKSSIGAPLKPNTTKPSVNDIHGCNLAPLNEWV